MSNTTPKQNLGIDYSQQKELFGHPTGLYTLFFAEMWERFSYYGMRALLILYMIKGFMGYGDKDATAVYGAYTALVYMTPFFGGMIADKLLGARVTVVIGAILMAAGHLLMMFDQQFWFFVALGFLIAGNGFFKPNISTMVGELYPPGSPKRDGGFTIFYIGINLGAAMAPLICGYVGETFGWHYGFGLATIGMIVGLAIFVAPTIITQLLILSTALASAFSLAFYNAGDSFSIISNIFVLIALLISAAVAVIALSKGGLPKESGGIPDPDRFTSHLVKVLAGTMLVIPIFVILVSGLTIFPGIDNQYQLIDESIVKPLEDSESKIVKGLAELVKEASRPAGLVLILAGLGASFYLIVEAFRMSKVARERMFVVFILTFFSLVFWAFFEQSGSSVNNFTDRNVDRVTESTVVTDDLVGTTQTFRLVAENKNNKDLEFFSQEFLGQKNDSMANNALLEKAIRGVDKSREAEKQMKPEKLQKTIDEVLGQDRMTMTALTYLREYSKNKDATDQDKTFQWTFAQDNVGKLGLGGTEVPASVFQSSNAIFIMIFGLVFTALWTFLGTKGLEPSTPVKFSLGLLQLGLGFLCLYFGAQTADSDGMVGMYWLLLMYLLLTTGELCLSPVGLSMVTKLSPARLVSTVMGSWFLATAFSQFLAAIIAQFAAVDTGDGVVIPVPSETVHIYGNVYQLVGFMAIGSAVVLLILSPLLKKWMHIGVISDE